MKGRGTMGPRPEKENSYTMYKGYTPNPETLPKSDGGLSSFPSFVLFGRMNLSLNKGGRNVAFFFFSCEEIANGRPLALTGARVQG